MHETNEAVTLIMEAADDDAEIIFGTVIDEEMTDEIKVTVIATGLGGEDRVSSGRIIEKREIIESHKEELSLKNSSEEAFQQTPADQEGGFYENLEASVNETMERVNSESNRSIGSSLNVSTISNDNIDLALQMVTQQTRNESSLRQENKILREKVELFHDR